MNTGLCCYKKRLIECDFSGRLHQRFYGHVSPFSGNWYQRCVRKTAAGRVSQPGLLLTDVPREWLTC